MSTTGSIQIPPEDLTTTLICCLRRGDTEAGNLLDRLYRTAIFRVAVGYLHSMEEAEDAVQEIFCKVLRSDQVPYNFRAWIYRIARNHCLDRLRERAAGRRPGRLTSWGQVAGTSTGVSTRAARAEFRSRLVSLLDELPQPHREVVWLRYSEGLSRSEIAEVLGLGESIVKRRLFEGLQRLRDRTDASST